MKQNIDLCGEYTYILSRFIDSSIVKAYIPTNDPQLLVSTSNLGNEEFKEVCLIQTKVRAYNPSEDTTSNQSYYIEIKVALLTQFYNEGYDYEKLADYAQGLATINNVGRAMRKHKELFLEYYRD